MTKKLSASTQAIIDTHARQEEAGIKALANPRHDYIELHFHTEESTWKGDVISETKVLRSNAGYYIGHEYQDRDFENAWLPYDRISGYYSSREAAGTDLELYRKALGH